MTQERTKRKLTAILSADVKGYSRLMGEDEVATIRTLTACQEVMASLIQQHRGRVVDSPGDNLLAEFSSVVDAVDCAVKIQEKLKSKNAELPEKRRMQFRIGVNLGDVVEEGERIYGDGVNIAARIEGLAQAGGICISRTAYEQVKNKLTLGYEYLGEHSVKNIVEPVRVYRVLTEPEAAGKVIGEKRAWLKRWQWAALAVAVVLVGIAVWIRLSAPPMEVASVERMAFPLPEEPSLAVLPFTNMSDDPKQEYFSDGITEEIITALAKIPQLFVIARNSTFTYKGKPVKVQKVAEDLGVRYVLEGGVRKAGDKIRITVQLIDAISGRHLWAERYDGILGDVFALQDKVTEKIVAALAVKLTSDDQENVANRGTDNVAAYDAFLQGWEHYRRRTRDDLVKAITYFERAIELDPDFGRAHAGLAGSYQVIIKRFWDRDLGWSNARSLMQKHLQMAMKNPTSLSYRMASFIRLYGRQHEEAITLAERAMALDPNDPDNHLQMGRALIFAGRSAEAVEFLKRAMRLDPHYPAYYLALLGIAQFCLNQFEEAATTWERAHKRDPGLGIWWIAASYAHLGRGQEAAGVLGEYIKKRGWSGVPVENTFKFWPFKDPTDLDRFADGLVKAGLPRPSNPVYRRQYEEAIAEAERAIALDPNDAKAQFTMAESLIFAGRSAEAAEFLKRAMRLDPNYPAYYLYFLGLAQFCLERFEEAATSLERYYKRKPPTPMWLLASTYAHLGREQEAANVLAKYMKRRGYKGYTVERVLKYRLHAFKDPIDTNRFAEGLRKAGLPMK